MTSRRSASGIEGMAMMETTNKRGQVDQALAQNIRRFRVRDDISQEVLAMRMGVTYQQIQKYERGANSISAGRIRDLCRIFDCTPNDLFSVKKNGRQDPTPSVVGLKMMRYFDQIKSGAVRGSVMRMIATYIGAAEDEHTV